MGSIVSVIAGPSRQPHRLACRTTYTVHRTGPLLARVLDAIEALLGGILAIGDDYYWRPPVRAAFDLSEPNLELTTGQLSDDVVERGEAWRVGCVRRASTDGAVLHLAPAEYGWIHLVLSYVLHGLPLPEHDFSNILGMSRVHAETMFERMAALESLAREEGSHWVDPST